jgi:DNA polymerase delta subunit 4
VNAEDLALLKSFDLNFEFGPCVGMSRRERWERACKNGLAPPPQVLRILDAHKDSKEVQSRYYSFSGIGLDLFDVRGCFKGPIIRYLV